MLPRFSFESLPPFFSCIRVFLRNFFPLHRRFQRRCPEFLCPCPSIGSHWKNSSFPSRGNQQKGKLKVNPADVGRKSWEKLVGKVGKISQSCSLLQCPAWESGKKFPFSRESSPWPPHQWWGMEKRDKRSQISQELQPLCWDGA